MNLAPIILFVYNRPLHTEKTLLALEKNELAQNSILYIYADGAKENSSIEELNKIEQVSNLIKKEWKFKKIHIIKRNKNFGLAENVIDGVTEIINKYGKVIVLEDDILVGKYFLKFMNEGLEIYKDEDKVYGVTGYCFPCTETIKEETYFLPIMSSWGYGTWSNRWSEINFDGRKLLNEVLSKKLEKKLDFGNLCFYQMLKDQVSGKNDSWAIRFYVSMFLNKGLFLFPNTSLLKNIGFDGTGIHCNLDFSKIHKGEYENDVNIPIIKSKILAHMRIIKKFDGSDNLKSIKKMTIGVKKRIVGLFAPEIIQLIKRKFKASKNNQEKSLIGFPRYTKTTFLLKGSEIIIPDSASFLFMQKEIFEEEIYRFKASNTSPYIIDGGANIGLATIYFKLLYPNSKVVAFEPDSEIFDILKNNIKSFNFINVELIQKGLWNENKKLSFKSEGADGGLIADVDKTVAATEMIEVVSLKPYLQTQVDFLKLDIEGSETIVLKDIQDDLVRVDRIFVEYHSFVGQPQTLNEIIDILTKAKFRLYMSIPGNNSLKHPLMGLGSYNNMDFQLNIFGYKEDK